MAKRFNQHAVHTEELVPMTNSKNTDEEVKDEKLPASDVSCMSRPMQTCLVLSVSFTAIFTSSLSINNLASSLYREEHLGITQFAVLFGSIVAFSPLSPVFIRLIGAKNVLVAAWLIFTVYTCCNFYPTFGTILPAAALKGIISCPMWTVQGLYITSAGEAYAKMFTDSSSAMLHAVLSKFNGIFFMFYESAQITGNLISSLVLFQSSYNTTSVQDKVCGVDAMAANNSAAVIQDPDPETVYLLIGVLLVCDVIGIVLTVVALPKLTSQGQEAGAKEVVDSLCSCTKMLVDKKMLLLLPLFMAQAMAISLLFADYTRDFISCGLGIQWVGYIMTVYGMCCGIFAVTINSAARYVGRLALFVTAVLADTSTLLIMLLWTPQPDDHVLYFIVPAVSGISEGILQSQFNTLVAQVFSGNKPPAFAMYHTSKALSFTISFLISLALSLRIRLYIGISLYVLGLLGYLILEASLKSKSSYDITENAGKTTSDKTSITSQPISSAGDVYHVTKNAESNHVTDKAGNTELDQHCTSP